MPSDYLKLKGTEQSCIAIMGYNIIDSSIMCRSIFTVLSIAGLPVLIQFLFNACLNGY
ncbi:hypothetical protein E2C01_077290 [Portunus trituberculatus]|uniref:Uncharacterized protein n=1 Tax=Portunus trituberculatus TaxID=210409 RepID=A0A5B7IJW7_PORTR|nr:hypothetical protein [Portunus trituberculatus]